MVKSCNTLSEVTTTFDGNGGGDWSSILQESTWIIVFTVRVSLPRIYRDFENLRLATCTFYAICADHSESKTTSRLFCAVERSTLLIYFSLRRLRPGCRTTLPSSYTHQYYTQTMSNLLSGAQRGAGVVVYGLCKDHPHVKATRVCQRSSLSS